jgi:hypothetical protein
LAHPEKNFYIAGMKAYGRAPTFLMATGYEQVRSIAAELTGDYEAAKRVELVLPETGVCSAPAVAGKSEAGCCGGPAPEEADACCVADADAKAAGEEGCGCSPSKPVIAKPATILAPAKRTSCCGPGVETIKSRADVA